MAISSIRLEEQEGFSLLAKRKQENDSMILADISQFAEENGPYIVTDELYHVVIHDLEEGLRDYYAVRIKHDLPEKPEEMEVLDVPSFTYFVAEHQADTPVEESYDHLQKHMETTKYRPYITAQSPLSDPFPLKIEILQKDGKIYTETSKRDILIPVQKSLYNEEIE